LDEWVVSSVKRTSAGADTSDDERLELCARESAPRRSGESTGKDEVDDDDDERDSEDGENDDRTSNNEANMWGFSSSGSKSGETED